MPATARACSDFFQYRMHEHFCIFDDLIGSDQFRDHPFDFVHKLCISECSLLNIQKFLLPFCCHGWGLDLLRHDRDQCNSLMCRKKVLCLFVSFTFHKSDTDQLLNRSCPGCGCSDSFPLHFFRHLICSGSLHCRQ